LSEPVLPLPLLPFFSFFPTASPRPEVERVLMFVEYADTIQRERHLGGGPQKSGFILFLSFLSLSSVPRDQLAMTRIRRRK